MSGDDSLDQIENLLVLNLIDGKSDMEAVKLLHRADYTSNEIGDFLGISGSTVRTKISDLRDKGEIEDA